MQISILRALNEISLLDKKISKQLSSGQLFVNYSVGGKPPVGYKNLEDVSTDIKSRYQSISDLIRRRSEIKSAIVSQNAITNVTIVGKTMTVASAIELKKSISLEKEFLRALQQSSASINRKVEDTNMQVEQKLENMLNNVFGGKTTKTGSDEYNAIAIPFKKDKSAEILDPLDIKKVIDEKIEYIDEFERTVDNILTESNATTMIEVSDS
ncbi:MAG: hypothetical protein H7836_08020 [Magnetococcus sp. YQC-3]